MAFQDPKNNIEQLGLEPNMAVADLGAGVGFYSFEAAKKVGSGGRVYAIEIQKELLDKIKQASANENLYNIETIWGNIEKVGGTKLADFSVDVVILSNILFQVEDKESLVAEVKRILRPNGRLLIVDWADSFGGVGPSSDDVIMEHEAEELFLKNGFTIERKIDAGENHYGFILRQNSEH